MSESEVSESVRKYLIKEYSQEGTVVCHFEATDTDGNRPDLLLFIEYQSPRRQWVTHSVESKRAKRYVTVSDRRQTCLGVQQARKYYANYRWHACMPRWLLHLLLFSYTHCIGSTVELVLK